MDTLFTTLIFLHSIEIANLKCLHDIGLETFLFYYWLSLGVCYL